MTLAALRNRIITVIEGYPGALNLIEDLIPRLQELKTELAKEKLARKK